VRIPCSPWPHIDAFAVTYPTVLRKDVPGPGGGGGGDVDEDSVLFFFDRTTVAGFMFCRYMYPFFFGEFTGKRNKRDCSGGFRDAH
jgi:hypothetical protein